MRIRPTIVTINNEKKHLAMKENIAPAFRRAHQGAFAEHVAAAQDFFQGTLKEFDYVTQRFVRLSQVRCTDNQFEELLASLLPEPKKPRVERNSGLMKAWSRRHPRATAGCRRTPRHWPACRP